MPRRSSSVSHLLRDVRGQLTDAAVSPLKTTLEPLEGHTEASRDGFDFASYRLLRKATKIAAEMIGERAATRMRKGSRLVAKIIDLMKNGETAELEKMRAKNNHHSYPTWPKVPTPILGKTMGMW